MKQLTINDKIEQPIVIALGFFDCIHLGHQEIIKQSQLLAHKCGAYVAVFTFSNNPFDLLNNKTKLILTYNERLDKLINLGVDYCISAEFNRLFMNMSGKDFLDIIFRNNIKGIVCGNDYSYGRERLSPSDLACYANKYGVSVSVINDVNYLGKRASSTLIRNYLLNGDIINANCCLGGNYFVKSNVVSGHKIGRKLNYPTANIDIPADKLLLAKGVYAGTTTIDSKNYKCIINIGERPTFNDASTKMEVHIIDFFGDLYNQTIKVEFIKFLRNITKFDTPEKLIEQINADKKATII